MSPKPKTKERTIQEIKREMEGLATAYLERKISEQSFKYLMDAAEKELKSLGYR